MRTTKKAPLLTKNQGRIMDKKPTNKVVVEPKQKPILEVVHYVHQRNIAHLGKDGKFQYFLRPCTFLGMSSKKIAHDIAYIMNVYHEKDHLRNPFTVYKCDAYSAAKFEGDMIAGLGECGVFADFFYRKFNMFDDCADVDGRAKFIVDKLNEQYISELEHKNQLSLV